MENNYDKEKIIEITNVLQEMGMPAHLKGFYYVREAILMVYSNENLLSHMMEDVYMPLAKRYNTSLHCVERVIRVAIENTWLRGNINVISKIFHNTIDGRKARPTNKEFIALLVDYMRIQNI